LEKPHWGINLLPFINSSTGLAVIKLSIRLLSEASMGIAKIRDLVEP
jgi:hypothetical protein